MRNESKPEKSKLEKKTMSLREFDNLLESQLKLTKAGVILGLAGGTVFLAAGIFLPKEINETWERIIEFSAAGISYAAAGISYVYHKMAQIQMTEFHMRPEWIDAFHKSLPYH